MTSRTPEAQFRRDDKIMRTVVRLKHSLNADDEITEHRAVQKALMTQGIAPHLELSLASLSDEA